MAARETESCTFGEPELIVECGMETIHIVEYDMQTMLSVEHSESDIQSLKERLFELA